MKGFDPILRRPTIHDMTVFDRFMTLNELRKAFSRSSFKNEKITAFTEYMPSNKNLNKTFHFNKFFCYDHSY